MKIMAPIIEVSDEILRTLNPSNYNLRGDLENNSNKYLKLPSGIYTAREKILFGKNWFQQHELLESLGLGMQTPLEFVELLRYAKEHDKELYNEITQQRSPLRAENLDAYFEKREGEIYMLTHNKTKAEKLDKDTLTKDRTPGISIESWISNPTSQGLPRKNVGGGDSYYWYPRNGAVARFDADGDWVLFSCYWDSSYWSSVLGVRGVRR